MNHYPNRPEKHELEIGDFVKSKEPMFKFRGDDKFLKGIIVNIFGGQTAVVRHSNKSEYNCRLDNLIYCKFATDQSKSENKYIIVISKGTDREQYYNGNNCSTEIGDAKRYSKKGAKSVIGKIKVNYEVDLLPLPLIQAIKDKTDRKTAREEKMKLLNKQIEDWIVFITEGEMELEKLKNERVNLINQK